ncbi:MAG: hypothetical protein QNJ38_03110 [Prochloraceae cyanobacterium]|nr:hypothetical protein [Prochloraceae cyanobacterium]
MESWKYPWGYSKRVAGEWYLELYGGDSDDLKGRFNKLIDILERSIAALKEIHTFQSASISISLLGEEILADGTIKEENYLEFVSIDCQKLEDLVFSITQKVRPYYKFFITNIFIDLNTSIQEKDREIILGDSANFYIGAGDYAVINEKTELYLSYSTFTNVWLKNVCGNDYVTLLDNSEASKLNLPRLRKFLRSLEQNLGVNIQPGESHLYSQYLDKTGFIFD